MDEEFAPDLSIQDREDLEVSGMSPRAIDDAIAQLRLRGGSAFTVEDVLAVGPLRKDEVPDPLAGDAEGMVWETVWTRGR